MAEQLNLGEEIPPEDTEQETQEDEESPKPDPREEALAAFKETTEALRRQNADLAEQLERLRTQQSAPAPKGNERLTLEQLNAMVESDQITEEQKQTTLRRYEREDLKAELKAELSSDAAHQTRAQKLDQKIREYTEEYPDIRVKGSEDRARVEQAYQRLVDEGYPAEDLSTQLTALRNTFGPAKKVREKSPPSHAETGGTGRGATRNAGGEGWKKGLPASVVENFEYLLDKGLYKDGTKGEDFKRQIQIARQKAEARVH